MKIKKLTFAVILILIGIGNQFNFGQTEKKVVQIKAYNSFDKVYAGSEFKLAVKAVISDGWHINSNKPHDDFLIPTKLTIDSTKGFTLKNIVYPKAQDVNLSFSDKPLSVWEGAIYLGGIVEASKDLAPGKYMIPVNVGYQSCNNQTCLPPATAKDTLTFEVVPQSAGISEINQDVFKNIDVNLSNIKTSDRENDSSISSVLEHSGILLSLLFIFIGGLALNLTPCVYPLIPITVGFFGGQSEGSTKKLFLMGSFFVIGMAITYSVIGVVTALSGAVFGSLLQNPIVIIFIALVFIVLSLSMFGVYEFQLPNSLVAKAGGAKSGYYGAFFMGLTMGIVAAPCIGPFVLGLVTYVAAKADPYYGFLMFFVLALGLGLPYLILAVFSGKIKKLPKAGEWMEAVKHIFGFILIGMAIYFLLPLLPKNFSGYLLPAFMILTAIYLLVFEKYGNKIKGFRIFKIAFSIIILAAAIYSLIPSQKGEIDWKSYTANTSLASLGSSKGMVIDFYADWCIPCKELDASTFRDPKVISTAKDFLTFKANMTKSLSPEVEALRNKYNIVGVPTVLIINSKGEEVKRITGYVDANEFLKILSNVK
ncbi:MAG: thioredoxin fold domain-containing protein [Bacteroidetes bacterium]|nr:thioredoxin fold domain-containing protein [Bacteroidota bacterium]